MPDPAPPRRWLTPTVIAAGLCALCAWSAWQRYAFLTSSPYPMGIDGYFYPIQLRALLEHGSLAYPASPLAFWLMAPLAWATDPITGAKLGAALGGALVAFPAYGVGARLGGGRIAGLAAAIVATTSAGSAYLSVEFVKNGWGLTIALGAIWLILGALAAPSRRRIALAALGVVAAALTHKMAVGLIAWIGVPAIVADAVARRPAASRRIGRHLGRVAIGAAVVAAVAVAIAALAPERFLAGRDLGALGELFTTHARWAAPALSIDANHYELTMGHEALAAGVVGLAAAAALAAGRALRARPWWRPAPRSAATTAAAIAVIALALVVAAPWIDVGDPQGLGFRLRIAAFVPLALAAAIAVGAVVPLAVAELARGAAWRAPALGTVAVAGLAIAGVAARPSVPTEGVVRAHPAMVAATMALTGAIPPDDTAVVSERHTMFMAAYYTRARLVLRPEAVPADHRWRLMPLAFIGAGSPLDRLLTAARHEPDVDPPRGFHPRDPNGLVLVREATWEWILARLPPRAARYYRQWHTI